MANEKPNQLAVDLVVNNAELANAQVANFTNNVVGAAETINKAGQAVNLGTNLDKQLNSVQHRFADIRQQLFQISTAAQGVKGFDGLGKATDRVYNQLNNLKTKLDDIRIASGKTTDPVQLERLRTEAAQAGAELDKLQRKIDRVSAGRQAAVARVQAATPAGGGANLRGIAGAATNFLPFELQQGASIAEAGVAAGAGPLLTVAAVGFALVKVSEKLRSDAEARLAAENKISAEMNAQLLAGQQLARDFQKQLDARTTAAELAKQTDIDAIRADIASRSEKRNSLINSDPAAAQAEQDAIIADLDRIDAISKQREAAHQADFADRHEAFLRMQANEREQIDKGIAKVKELRDGYKTLFDGLFATAGENNPFVRLFSDADAAIEKTRIATRGLSKDLQDQAAAMTATDNGNKLFSARLNNALQVDELRSTADRFRNAGDSKPFIDPKILATPGAFDRFATDQFVRLRLAGNGSDVNLASLQSTIAREQIRAATGGDNASIQDRFDRQLAIIQGSGATNEQQRQEADRRLLAIGEKLDPTKLTAAQRDAVASAAEREAVRTENQEKDAKAQRDAQQKTFDRIDDNLKQLLGIAQSDGLTGVIRIINDAGNNVDVELGKRPNDDDVSKANER